MYFSGKHIFICYILDFFKDVDGKRIDPAFQSQGLVMLAEGQNERTEEVVEIYYLC